MASNNLTQHILSQLQVGYLPPLPFPKNLGEKTVKAAVTNFNIDSRHQRILSDPDLPIQHHKSKKTPIRCLEIFIRHTRNRTIQICCQVIDSSNNTSRNMFYVRQLHYLHVSAHLKYLPKDSCSLRCLLDQSEDFDISFSAEL